MSKEIIINCKHLACVAGPNDTEHHIIFDPLDTTVVQLRRWVKDGGFRKLRCFDRSGEHITDQACLPMSMTHDYGTIILTTVKP